MSSPPARHVIAVGSGKGGVGKTTVSLNLALATLDRGHAVGILDADLYGPNLPLMVGITRDAWTEYWTLARNVRRHGQVRLQPVDRYGLKIVSAGFILAEDQPLVVEGIGAQMLVRQLVHETAWGALDYLIVDLPPGTGDIHQVLLQAVPYSGAIVVVTPQYVAHLDAKKAVQMYRRRKVPVLGGIENMAAFACPHCGKSVEVFPTVPDARSIWSLGVDRLGSIPLDPAVSLSSDTGSPLYVTAPQSPQAQAFRQIAAQLESRLNA